MFSNSGNTTEIINIIPIFKNIGLKTVGICCNEISKFKELCDIIIITPFNNEISGVINKIPTNSCMSHLIFCNILVSLLKNNISLDKYKENHLSGNIGKNLLKVKDIFIKGNRLLHQKMLQLNIPHTYIERDGEHNWVYWHNAVQYQLLFFKNYFKKYEVN